MAAQPNVVLAVLDTLRRDRVSAYGYERETTPAFDAFAENATLFEDAVSQSSWSIPAHASLFTGKYPSEHGATTVRPVLRANRTLATELSRTGYETYAISPNVYIRPTTGFARGFDEFHTESRFEAAEQFASRFGAALNTLTATPRLRRPLERGFNRWRFRGPETGTVPPREYGVCRRVRSVLDRAEEPFFLFVNLPHAHLPRSPASEHRRRFVADDLPCDTVVTNERAHTFGRHTMDSRAMDAMSHLYDADVRTLDDRLRELLLALEGAECRGETLVALTADHGEHLGEHGLVGHQHSVFDPVVSVPLAVDFPTGRSRRVEEQVETRRLYHTILDVADVEDFPERSLASGVGDDVARGSFHSPMLDLRRLYRDGTVVYDRDLLGARLGFERHNGSKRVTFDGTCWELSVPEPTVFHSLSSVQERSV